MYHTIIHFEIPANNIQALANFYSQLFGWKIERAPGPIEYWLIEAAPQGKGVNGGMMQRQSPTQVPTNHIQVESVDDYSAKVQKLGGKIVLPKQTIPGVGYIAMALDIEGNPFGMFQADPGAK